MSPTALRQAPRKRRAQERRTSANAPLDSRLKYSVLIVGPSPPPYNGMTRAVELTMMALKDDFSIVHLDTADRRGLSNMGQFEPGNLLLAAQHGLRFLWLMLTRRPRIVYVPISQSWLPFLRDCMFLIPARVLRRKVVIHLHGGYFGKFYRETSPLMRSIIRYALEKSCCTIVLGKRVADAFDGIMPRERIRVVPNGIPDAFAGKLPKGLKDAEMQVPVLLYLSTLVEEKGFLDLIRALPKVIERVGNVRAIFAGEWFSQHDREAASQLIDSLGLRQVVEFVGAVGPNQKQKLLRSAATLVFPTAYRYEGHPYVVLEAMAAGLPVISTNIACIPETVRDGVEGYLIDAGDTEALADRIGRLIANTCLRKRMGQASRQRFLEEFTYERFAESMRGVFAEQVRSA